MKKMRTAVCLLLLCLVSTLGSACSTTAEVDRIGLYYTGGMIQGHHFKKVVNPGSGAKFLGWGDTVEYLPAGQRNYIVSKQVNEGDRQGADIITVPAKGGVSMDFEISVYFKLNTHTNDIKGFEGGTLRRFYEQICKKYGCTSSKGWDKMLNDNFRKIIEASMREKVFTYTVDELYANSVGDASGNEDAIKKIQQEIAAQLKNNINQTLGGEFFCGPTFDRDKKECPDFQFNINSAAPHDQSVLASYEAIRSSANGVLKAEQDALAQKAAAEGTRAANEALRGSLTPEYLELKRIQALDDCAKSEHCTIVISGNGTLVNASK